MTATDREQSDFLTADLWDAHHAFLQSLDIPWRDYGARRAFWGRAETISTQENVQSIRRLLDRPGDGRILLIDALGSLRLALLGDRLARRAIDNGWAGVIVHGAIRDSTMLGEMLIGVKALGTTALRPFSCDAPAKIGITLDLGVALSRGTFYIATATTSWSASITCYFRTPPERLSGDDEPSFRSAEPASLRIRREV